MNRTGGWVIWATQNGKVRMFHVAKVAEEDALKRLAELYPAVEVVSRHTLADELVKGFLAMKEGDVEEWVAADPKNSIAPGGVPISTKMS